MADVQAQTTPSLTELFADLSRETSTLVRQQMELARVEMSEKISRLSWNISKVAIGGAIAIGGLLAILAGIVLVVAAMGVPAWAAALAVGIAFAIIGYVVAQAAISAMKREDIAPKATIETLKESAEWVKSPTKS